MSCHLGRLSQHCSNLWTMSVHSAHCFSRKRKPHTVTPGKNSSKDDVQAFTSGTCLTQVASLSVNERTSYLLWNIQLE